MYQFVDVPKDIIDINQSGGQSAVGNGPSLSVSALNPDANHNHLQSSLHLSPSALSGASLSAYAAAAAISPKLSSLGLNGYAGLKGMSPIDTS